MSSGILLLKASMRWPQSKRSWRRLKKSISKDLLSGRSRYSSSRTRRPKASMASLPSWASLALSSRLRTSSSIRRVASRALSRLTTSGRTALRDRLSVSETWWGVSIPFSPMLTVTSEVTTA